MTTDRWSAIERIFHEALERPAEARAAFLTESCGGDDELRREVQSLLDETSQTGFLEQPALQIAAGLAGHSSAANLTGQRIGVYLVHGLLGKGGMGEVYRARDTRLDRDVAIKVLPRAFTADPDRLARFEREARVLASLNHPHIGMIHGLEESAGTRALVLELVEGDTLADRVARGPVPIKQALLWARQIADALDAAHEKGIVHRDLKPANVKITPNDVVKVLDFGLARTFENDNDDLTRSPTITSDGGVILGTAAYMSPEQARGQALGKRADIWAFGCVFYEMLTGRVAFDGQTVSDTIAAVLHHEPDWTALPARLPSAVTTLLQRCLEKDVKQRRRDIGDVRAELDDAIARPPSGLTRTAVSGSPPARGTARPAWVLAAAGGVVVAALAGLFTGRWWGARSTIDSSATEVSFQRMTDSEDMDEAPAVSSDGKDVAFVRPVNGRRQIWIYRAGGRLAVQVTQADVDHDHPRWLPESRAILYFAAAPREGESGTLLAIPTLGGSPRFVARATTGADVNADGQIAAFRKTADGIVLVILDEKGADIKTIKPPPAVEYAPPRWSPDRRSIAFATNESNGTHAVNVIDVASGTLTVVATALRVRGVAWLPDNSGLVYASSAGSTLFYPPIFTLRTVARDGGHGRQLTLGDESYVDPDIVQPGKLVASRVRMTSDVWAFPVSGSAAENVKNGIQVTRQTGRVQTPTVSWDGKRLAYLSDSGAHGNIWVANIDGSDRRQLTFEQNPSVSIGIPLWSPKDDRIVFIRSRPNDASPINFSEWIINANDGSGERLLASGATSAAWSSDGKWIYYQRYSSTDSTIYKVPADGGAEVLVRRDAGSPAVWRDGAVLYYSPHGPGNANEIFKASPESAEGTFLTRYAASRIPLWPTGAALSPDGRWLAVPLKDGGTTNIWAIPTTGGAYRQLTDFGSRSILIARQVCWSPDGKFVYGAVVESDADIVLLDSSAPRDVRPAR